MNAFGTRPTYRIFAVVTLITGLIYFVFNATYLKKRSREGKEGNDIVKKKPQSTDAQDIPEKHKNDISLHEKPLDERVNEDKKRNTMKNNGVDNKGFSKESRDTKLSTETNERKLMNVTETVEAIENAKNTEKIEGTPRNEKHEDKVSTKSNVTQSSSQESNVRESCFTNPCFKTDDSNQCEIMVESEEINDKRADQGDS